MDKSAQEAHADTAPAPDLDRHQAANFLLQPGSIFFADVGAAGIVLIS